MFKKMRTGPKPGEYGITESKEMSKFIDQQNRIKSINRPMHILPIDFDKRNKVTEGGKTLQQRGAGITRYPYRKEEP